MDCPGNTSVVPLGPFGYLDLRPRTVMSTNCVKSIAVCFVLPILKIGCMHLRLFRHKFGPMVKTNHRLPHIDLSAIEPYMFI